MIVNQTKPIVLALAFTIGVAATGVAQGRRGGPPPPSSPRVGTTERATVQNREVALYLPPSYASDAMRRFPVVYLITEVPLENLPLSQAADKLAAAQGFSEPIVVVVDPRLTTGDQDRFVADDLVAYVDTHYRTIAARISRGLADVGGKSALPIAMKRPTVFSSVCLMSVMPAEALPTLDAAASNLQRYYAIAVEVGTRDSGLAANRQLHEAMTRLQIPHYYEEYEGDHTERLRDRIESHLLPFFSRNLAAPANPTSPAVQ